MTAVLETVWTTVAVLGFLLSLAVVQRAWLDHTRLKAAKINSVRALVARHAVRSEARRCIVLACFLLAGVGALLLPNPSPEIPLTSLALTTRFALLGANVLVAYSAWADLRYRSRLATVLRVRRPQAAA